MNRIRPFLADDIPQVARLHRQVWQIPAEAASTDEAYRDYFLGVFLSDAVRDTPMPSLVCEDAGRIVGFLGLVPRRFRMNGRRCHAVVSSQFVVDPARNASLVALRLARAYLDGPQDLSIADEANDVSRRIWEGLGGSTARLFSLYWTRPLQPARLAVSLLRQRPGMARLAAVTQGLTVLADVAATRLPGSYFRQAEPRHASERLCVQTVLAYGSELLGDDSLRVEYDQRTLQWLLERAGARTPGGRLLTATLRRGDRTLGWYICHLGSDGVGEVAQLCAAPDAVHEVLDRLFYDAWRQGAIAVTGRLDAHHMQALSDRYCLFHRRGPWVLVNARRPDVMQAFHAGDASFSRLDGEWSLRFGA